MAMLLCYCTKCAALYMYVCPYISSGVPGPTDPLLTSQVGFPVSSLEVPRISVSQGESDPEVTNA